MRRNRRHPSTNQRAPVNRRHIHWSNLGCTNGARRLLESANAAWLRDVIAILQPRALCDPRLREFQLWELFRRAERKVVIICSRDAEDVVFRLAFGRIDLKIDYLRLYLARGTLCLPREYRSLLASQLSPRQPTATSSKEKHVLTIERYGRFWSLKENGTLLCVAVYKKGATAVKTRIEELLSQQQQNLEEKVTYVRS